jgi:hypothetical protein
MIVKITQKPPAACFASGRTCATGASATGVWPVPPPVASPKWTARGATVLTFVAALSSPFLITLIILLLRWLARPHTRMYVEIRERCADIQARSAAAYETPVPDPSVDGYATARAGTPDPARAVAPRRVHIEMGGHGRHRVA